MNRKSNEIYDDSIDLIDSLFLIWKNKLFISRVTLFFTLFSILFSLQLDNIYQATSIFYPHLEKDISDKQELKNLAGLAGINLGNELSENIPPTLYPKIVSSPQFKIELLDATIFLNKDKFSFREYLIKNYLQNKLSYRISNLINFFFKKDLNLDDENINILKLSDDEYELHEYLSESVILNLNEEEGFINLIVEDKDPIIASQVAKKANEILQTKIIDFKLKNISDIYDFVGSQLEIAKNNFYIFQDSLAIFSDRNKNIKSDLFLNQYSRIESEYLISKNIYNELAINKERTAIEVKKNTPIFTIIKPVVIPNEKSEPKRTIIVFLSTFIGFSLSIIFTLYKKNLVKIWGKLNIKA